MRTNWASGDKVTAADFNEISTMLARHDATVSGTGLSGLTLTASGSTVVLTLPDGTVQEATVTASGGGGEPPTLTTADLTNLMGL